MHCPKCGREADESAVICAGCDFILDASFLGDDIMDAEADRRVRRKSASKQSASKQSDAKQSASKQSAIPSKGAKRKRKPPREKTRVAPEDESWAADALILGDLDDDDVASFQANDTGLARREVTMARMYVGGSLQALLMPDAVLEVAPDVALDTVRLTPFERHVLELVNGKRPVSCLKEKAQLKDEDFQTALALLADKGFLRLVRPAKEAEEKAAQKAAPKGKGARAPTRQTLIVELPESAERGSADEDVRAFEAAKTGPSSDGAPGQTLLGVASSFEEEAEVNARSSGASFVDDGPLSFADSIASQEGVFALDEEALPGAQATSTKKARQSKPERRERQRRAHRRPPLPGEIPPPPADEEEAFRSIHDEPTADTPLPRPSSEGPALAPPPLPPDASREAPVVVEAEAAAFERLETAPPAPISVDAADISLIEVDTLPLPAQQAPTIPSPTPKPKAPPASPVVAPPPLPGTVAPPAAAPPPLPGSATRHAMPPPLPGSAPPPLPGAAPVLSPSAPPTSSTAATAAPARPAAPPRPATPSPAASPRKREEPGSGSGEAAAPAVSFEMQRKAARIFEQAEKDIAEGNLSSAIMNVKLALIYNPSEKRYRHCLEEWERMAVEPKPSKEAAILDEAQEAEQRGDYEKALALLEKALSLAPKNAGLHNRIGVLLATRLKRYKEAAQHVLTAIELAPGNLAYKNNLGKILAKEESAIHKMPRKKRAPKGEEKVVVKKLRPKFF